MGQALYRKYRSKSLDEIVGQSHITTILQRAIAADQIAHAYLLTGPKGVGKTSIARILAHEINKLPYTSESTHLDIIEIDAASNNGVDDIRELREKVQIAPSSARKKIYIIDEVHMLSKQAFNALLKTLEEPPEHVVFILATTDADKLPATIISRVQRFNFRAIVPQDAVEHLRTIAAAENITVDDDALQLIALHGNGSFRDSISLLDQLRHSSDDGITRQLIEQVMGLASSTTVDALLSAYQQQDFAKIVALLNQAQSAGTPAGLLAGQLMHTIHEQILHTPSLLPLLDQLTEVQRSAWPYVKLLTAMAGNLSPQPTAAEIAPTRVPVAPTTPALQPPAQDVIQATTAPAPAKPAATAQPLDNTADFNWAALLANLKDTAAGTYALLSKCGYSVNNTMVTIYAGRAFTKKQIEKALPAIQATLQSIGVTNTEITVLTTQKPASDSTTAAVLAMMGGGEEVTL
ncbi:MAG: DNA polymerase III subunit gamma/tau [Candidatus Saccharimonas sp.]